jgi:RimJ/RimL family protein N-acetyltransferase
LINKPVIVTKNLEIRILSSQDRNSLQEAADCRDIADTMISVPYPFTEVVAENWIKRAEEEFDSQKGYHFGIFERNTGKLTGYITLRELEREHSQVEFSFWIAKPEWGKGYATEACRAVVDFGFQSLGINRIYAFHMVRNPASGRVLEKLGFVEEGLLRECVIKWDKFEDVVIRAMLKRDWLGNASE